MLKVIIMRENLDFNDSLDIVTTIESSCTANVYIFSKRKRLTLQMFSAIYERSVKNYRCVNLLYL